MKRTYPERPIVGVGLVVWRAGRVLLVRRAAPPRQGGWSLPGGAQEIGETATDAGLRELREETGVEARITELIDVVDLVHRDAAGRVEYHYTLIDYAADWVAGDGETSEEVSEVAWVDPETVAGYDLWRETERVIHLSRARRAGQ